MSESDSSVDWLYLDYCYDEKEVEEQDPANVNALSWCHGWKKLADYG